MERRIKIFVIAGARPNFIKIWPLLKELQKHKKKIKPVLIHTGQHYDFEMSKIFFNELNIPKPDYYLGVKDEIRKKQIEKIIIKLKPVFSKEKPDLAIVVGDVNSTLAGALTAEKMNVSIVHIEAGLRSFDRRMPEETNRILTDHISDLLFVSDPQGVLNLKNEGIKTNKIFYVGNIMIDTLKKISGRMKSKPEILNKLGVGKKNYAVLTLHRPENVDNKEHLRQIFQAFAGLDKKIKIVWPVHPRAKKQLKKFNLLSTVKNSKNIVMIKPLGYLEMMSLLNGARFVLTDSGGIQEESTILGVPCLTLRSNTERPVTVKVGTNTIVGGDKNKISNEIKKILAGRAKRGKIPKYWDGKTAKRIIKILVRKFRKTN